MRPLSLRQCFIEPLESRIAPATISVAPVIVDEGDTGGTQKAHIVVTLDAAASSDVTFDYALVDGTAHEGLQYNGNTAVPGQATTVTISAGQTTASFDVGIIGNNMTDDDSSFTVMLSNPSSGSSIDSSKGSAAVTIWDDDRTVNFTQDSLNQTTAEGDSGIHNLSYSVHLSAPAQHPISVHYATADGTGDGTGYGGAISTGAAADFVAASGTFTFAAGSTADQSFTVGIKGDTIPGPNENFNVLLSKTGASTDPSGYKLDTTTTAATITNDDADSPLTVSLGGDVTTSEGGNAVFTVKLSRLSESPVVITYHTTDGTATAASDYTAQTAVMKTIVSSMTDTISVPIHAVDSLVEGAESFKLTLDSATVHNAGQTLVSPNSSTATILADPLPKLKVSDVTVLENAGGAGQTYASFTVTLGYDDNRIFTTTQPGYFHFATMDGTAMGTADGLGDGDYKTSVGDFPFLMGTTNGGSTPTNTITIKVPITKDSRVESNETFLLKLTPNPGGSDFGSATATGTIVDTNVQVSVPDVRVAEGNDGTSSAVFALVLGKPVPVGYTLQVDYQTADTTGANAASHAASGSSPQDYVPVTKGTVTFAAGATVGTVSIGILGDRVLEADETFSLNLLGARLVPTGGMAAEVFLAGPDFGGTGTIVNDDGPGVTASVTANAVTLPEGASNSTTTADFKVHLSSAYSSDVKISYNVTELRADGTTITLVHTTNPANLAPLVIPAYAQDGTISVSFTHADTVGHDQILSVTLTAVTPDTGLAGSTFLPLASAKTAKTTILEDDAFVKIAGAAKLEGQSGTSVLPFAVQLVDINKNPVKLDHAVSIPYTTVDGTGAAGASSTGAAADFVAQAGTITFQPGQNATTIGVKINGDTLGGVDENFQVKLSSATGAGLYTNLSTATGTILNDDGAAPVLTLVAGTPGVEPPATGGAGSPATLIYKLSKASDSAVSFDYDTMDLTPAQFAALQPNSPDGSDLATASTGSTANMNFVANDYTPRSSATEGRITIPSGQVSGSFAVTVLTDTINENAEHFGLTLKNITGAPIASGTTLTAVGTIAANDQPTVSVANVSTVEGTAAAGAHNVTFTIKLSAATTVPVTFNVQTVPTGTATAGADYVPLSSKLVTIPVGETQVTQTVSIKGDDTAGEGDETFIFRVSAVHNAIPGSVDAVGTIQSDEASFTVAPATTVSENGEVASFKVTRTGDLTLPADVTFTTIDGSAKSSGATPDFIGGTGTVHFAANATEAFVKVALVNDNRHEGTENFSVKLTGATNGVLGAAGALTGTATITDDDAIPTATITSPAAIHETDSGTTPATFTITLDHANDESAIVFNVSTMDGTAHAGSDFTGLTAQTVTIPAGQLSATFNVAVQNDTIFDSAKTETFKANVTLDATAGVGKAKFAGTATSISGTGSIIDNETAPQISIAAATFTEGSPSSFVASLNHASDLPVTVKYYTVDGTAKSAGTAKDFTGKTSTAPGVLTFAAGSTTATINTITTVDDSFVEGNETFKLQLVSPSGATLNPAASSAIGTIADNDHAYVSINDVSLVEGNNGTQNAIFTVTLQGDTAAPIKLNYATASDAAAAGIATAGTDYTATSGFVTLGGPNGAHTAQIMVKVIGDLVKESTMTSNGDETFKVILSGDSVATLAKSTGVGTILDDGDTQGTISISNASVVEGDGTTNTMLHYTATLSQPAPAGGVSFTVKTSELQKVANAARLNSDFLQPTMANDATKDLVVTIPAGQTTGTFDVAVKADDTFEPTEFLNVSLTNITGAQPGNVVGTGTIYDNDLFFSSKVIKWHDVDGDLVTLSTSKGNFSAVGFGFDTTSTNIGTMGGRILNQLNLIAAGGAFAHANISILASQQPDATGALTGNGRVDVGYIRANTIDTAPTVLEMTGIDLGTVKVGGDLSRINAGDLFDNAAVGLLDVYSLGVNSGVTDTAAAGSTNTNVAISQLIAGAATIKVANDVSGVIEVTGGTAGRIGNLIIGGALRGTAIADSARILITGGLGKATIHDIIGGAGNHSASLTQFDTTAVLGSLTVTGNITAGTGSQTAHVLFPTIGSVTIGGSMHGGFISAANSLGTVTIDGDLDTGAKIYGGGLANEHAIKSVVVKGKVNNGQILGGYTVNINDTAANQVAKTNADAQIDSVEVDGSVTKFDIFAGVDPASSTTFAQDNAALFSRIAKVVINGAIMNNSEAHYISAESIGPVSVDGVAKMATLAGTDLGSGSNFLLKFSL